MTIAAVALSALAVPSAAMACTNPGSPNMGPSGRGANGSHGQWNNWKNAFSRHHWHGGRHTWPSQPSAPAAQAPAEAAPAAPAAPTVPAPKPPATASPSSPGAATPASGALARVVALVNEERGKVGCSPLTVNEKLAKAAQDHSEDMASHQNMSHTGSDGSDPGQRITRAGYSWISYGENVAYGYSTPEQVMAGWMSSPGHKSNILNCGFKDIGVGLAQPGSYWTQDFGTAR